MSKEQAYYDWSDERGFRKAVSAYANEVNEIMSLPRGTANTIGRTFLEYQTDHSIRSEYHRGDYEHFRPSEATPKKPKDIIKACMIAYNKVGIVKQVIDLMAEFACTGIRFQHQDKRTERFFNKWFRHIQGKERSERFLNLLYRVGNVVINTQYGKITKKQENELKRAHGTDDDGFRLAKPDTKKRTIPLKYTFLSPLSVKIIGGELAAFSGKKIFALKVTQGLRQQLQEMDRLTQRSPRVTQEPQEELKALTSRIPDKIRNAIKNGMDIIPLDQTKISSYHYKKDDWQTWANPMVYSILDDLILYDKLKLADISALDGAISNIRLWTLGVLDGPQNSIIPTKAMLTKLRNHLARNVGGGTMDLVWGPELTFTESKTQVHQFLGKEKYVPTLDAIYDGLGIPSVLRSGSNQSNNSNNFIALKTFVERLEYGRDILVQFWTEQVRIVQLAMGFTTPPKIVFDNMIISDEASEKQILLNMVDRDIISVETFLEYFGKIPEIEKLRVAKEWRNRNKTSPDKASPFHTPEKDHDYKKIFSQRGVVTPGELGIDLDDRSDGEKTAVEQQLESQMKMKEIDSKRGESANPGRPRNIPETKKRKPKPKPEIRNKADFVNTVMWANEAQKTISEIVTPAVLSVYGKKNLRQLSKSESAELEQIKFGVLCAFEPYTKISAENVYKAMKINNASAEFADSVAILKEEFNLVHGKDPTLDELRQIQSSAYAMETT